MTSRCSAAATRCRVSSASNGPSDDVSARWLARTAALLRTDRSAVFWARAGAACGLFGVICQSVWDTALRMPANAVLFAYFAMRAY